MSVFKTEMLSRSMCGRDDSSAMSRRPRRYGVSSALQTKPILAVVERIEPQAVVNEDVLPSLHRAA